jgi:hypothetical protein
MREHLAEVAHVDAGPTDRAIPEMMASATATPLGSQHTGLLKEVKLNRGPDGGGVAGRLTSACAGERDTDTC